MQFITTGNRIAVENFVLGDLYTITYTNGTYINSACIGIGDNFVTFQRNEPELLFSLTMATAELVSSIELYAGSGTNNYNDLTNKPQINDVELVGNKSLSDLGIQATISDIDTIRSGAAAGATAVQPAALAGYQTIIDSSHKLDADLVDDTTSTNKFATAAQLSQIETNKNNILSTALYGTCDTAGATAAKIVDVPSGFVLRAGCVIGIRFTNTNSASNVTLNVGNTGNKSIRFLNSIFSGTRNLITGAAGYTIFYMYDGEYWNWVSAGYLPESMRADEASAGTATGGRLISPKVLADAIDERIQPILAALQSNNNRAISDLKSAIDTRLAANAIETNEETEQIKR